MSFTLKIFYQNMLYNILYVNILAFVVLKQNTIYAIQNTKHLISDWFTKVKQNTIIDKQNTNKNDARYGCEEEDEKAIYLRFKSVLSAYLITSKVYYQKPLKRQINGILAIYNIRGL